jgi:hypothetical protein
MGFDAGTAVEPYHIKLKPFTDFDEDLKEPSDKQIAQLLKDVQVIMADLRKSALTGVDLDMENLDEADPAQMLKAMEALQAIDPEVFVHMQESMAGAYSALCSGRPTKAQLLKLPLRHRMMFYGDLQSEVISPEAGSAAGAKVLKLPQRAASGQ